MNLDYINKWLTIVANVGVRAGIVFLAYELQQNTLATDHEVANNLSEHEEHDS